MAIKPSTEQINRLADQRLSDLGIKPPVFSEYSLPDERTRRTGQFEEKRQTFRDNAAMSLNAAYEREQQREAEAGARNQAALDAQIEQLKANYLSQPGATDADFDRALPRLLERQREDAALSASSVFDQQVAEAKRRIGSIF